MIFIVTPTHKRALDWLQKNYPKMNPYGSGVKIINTNARDNIQRLRGHEFQYGDQLVYIERWRMGDAAEEIDEVVARMLNVNQPGVISYG